MNHKTLIFIPTLINNAKQVLFILLAFCLTETASADSLDRSKIIVSYAYNFAKHIKWPNEKELDTFKIALYQVDERKLLNEFNRLHKTIRIKNVDIHIKQTSNIDTLKDYNMIYVGSSDNAVIANIQAIIEGKPILLVTNAVQNKGLVMINLRDDQNQQLKFDINKANLLNSKLEPQPELILLGGTEIDVAKLYRVGQNSLIKLQNQLITQHKKLKLQQNQLESQKANLSMLIKNNLLQEKNYTSLLTDITRLNTDIKQTKNINNQLLENLKVLKSTITSNKTTISNQKIEIDISKKEKKNLARQVDKRNQELSIKQKLLDQKKQELTEKVVELEQQQQRLKDVSNSILDKEYMLDALNITLSEQKISIEKQKKSIHKLDELVHAQKRSLYFLWGIVALTIALFLLAFIAYRGKRKDNGLLATQSRDLLAARDKLAIAKQKAEKSNHTKGVFLSLMSHELRTPLQAIMGYTDLVIEELEAAGNYSYSDQLMRVTSNSERLLTLINNTLDLAKIEGGKMEVQLTRTNLSALIDEAASNINPLLKKNENQLFINIDDNTHTPSIDYEKSLQILVNLLSNATKFTKNGTITVSLINSPEHLKLTVHDTGVGLTKDQLDTIFYQFHQVDHKGAIKTKGTGLGLSITKHFCELMGGSIIVKSEAGIGTSFIVDIPLPVIINSNKSLDLHAD